MALSERNAAYDFSLFEEEEEVVLPESNSQKNKVYDIRTERQRRRKPRIDPLTSIVGVAVSSLVIVALTSIVHGQAQLTELNQQISDAQVELTQMQSYYTQMEMKVENKLGPSVVEEYAKNVLGMEKTQSFQKEFISISEGDKAVVANVRKKNIFEMVRDAIRSAWSDQ